MDWATLTWAFTILGGIWATIGFIKSFTERFNWILSWIPIGAFFSFFFQLPSFQRLSPEEIASGQNGANNSQTTSTPRRSRAVASFQPTLKFLRGLCIVVLAVLIVLSIWWILSFIYNISIGNTAAVKHGKELLKNATETDKYCIDNNLFSPKTPEAVREPCVKAKKYAQEPSFSRSSFVWEYIRKNQHILGIYTVGDIFGDVLKPVYEGWVFASIGLGTAITFVLFLLGSTDLLKFITPQLNETLTEEEIQAFKVERATRKNFGGLAPHESATPVSITKKTD